MTYSGFATEHVSSSVIKQRLIISDTLLYKLPWGSVSYLVFKDSLNNIEKAYKYRGWIHRTQVQSWLRNKFFKLYT